MHANGQVIKVFAHMPRLARRITYLEPSSTGCKPVFIVSYGACHIGRQKGDGHVIN